MMRALFAALLLLHVTLAPTPAAAAGPYPCDRTPQPGICLGMVKLTASYSGPIVTVQKASTTSTQLIGLVGDAFDSTTLYTWLTGEIYGRVTQWFSQLGGFVTTCFASPTCTAPFGPKIQPTSAEGVAINNVPALSFQGGSNSGAIYGMEIQSVNALGITAQNYTFMMVLRPTSSRYINQAFAPGSGNGIWAYCSGLSPVTITGNTTVNSTLITSVSSTSGIVAGQQIIVSGPFGPFPVPVMVTNVNAGLSQITVSVGAISNTTGGTLVAGSPLIQAYANGGNNPNGPAVTDNGTFTLEPHDTALEADPIVLTFTSNATGVKIWENEILRSSTTRSALSGTCQNIFIGYADYSQTGGQSLSGDFWMEAFLAWGTGITPQQAAVPRADFYKIFNIPYQRSHPTAETFACFGDSIVAGYLAGSSDNISTNPSLGGLYGMCPRVADQLPSLRFLNYSQPGSQVSFSTGTPACCYTVGMIPGITSALTYSKKKTISMLLGGGNDMVNQTQPTNVTFNIGASSMGWPSHPFTGGERVTFTQNSDTLPTPLGFYPNVWGNVYWVCNIVDANNVQLSLTSGGTCPAALSGSSVGTHIAVGFTKTSGMIFANIQSAVTLLQAAHSPPATAPVIVCTVIPRADGVYATILPATNTLITNNAGGSPSYTLCNTASNVTLANNPNPAGTFTSGPAFKDGTHPNDIGHPAAAGVIEPLVQSAM